MRCIRHRNPSGAALGRVCARMRTLTCTKPLLPPPWVAVCFSECAFPALIAFACVAFLSIFSFSVIHKKDLIRAIKRSTAESMAGIISNKEFEGYVKSRGDKSHPKLMKKITNKATAFGVAIPTKWGCQPWKGPALWEKGKAAEALKAAMAAKDGVALAAAIAATDKLEGVKFVKIKLDAKGKPTKEQPKTACSELLAEAKALGVTLEAEVAAKAKAAADAAAAAQAAAAVAAAPVAEAAPVVE